MQNYVTKRFAHPAWIEIDLDQFVENIRAFKNHISQQKICLAIKANAYGHGLVPIAQVAEVHGIDYLAVAHLQEGALLREAGITIPILVLGALHEEQLHDLLHYNLEFTIASQYKAKLVADLCKKTKTRAKVHVEIETGMQRTGTRPETALRLIEELQAFDCFDLIGIYSHLARSDEPNHPTSHEQIKIFGKLVDEVRKTNPDIIAHLANSSGILHYPESYFDMVRPGILLFGYTCPEQHPLFSLIKPFFSVKAKVAFFKVVQENQGVSYNHTYKTSQLTRIVTVPIGYGDGLRRSLSNKACVLIRGKRYPIVGTICMDQFMVDIGMNEAYVGDDVVLIGKQENEQLSLQSMAKIAETIPYEILCNFNDRLDRIYKYEGKYI